MTIKRQAECVRGRAWRVRSAHLARGARTYRKIKVPALVCVSQHVTLQGVSVGGAHLRVGWKRPKVVGLQQNRQ